MASDERAFEALFREHAPFVLRTIRRFGVRPAEVEDATQEVFLVAHRKLDTLRADASPRAWLAAIARRVAADHRKRAHVKREEGRSSISRFSRSSSQSKRVLLEERREILEDALSTLDEAKRNVFVLYELEGMTMPEIAIALECPLQTAYSRLHAARATVREFIDELSATQELP